MYYTLISPDGEKHRVINRRKFAEAHNLKKGAVDKLVSGERHSINGWFSTSPKSRAKKKKQEITLIHLLTKEVRKVGFIKDFAKEFDICKYALCELVNGKRLSHKGWILLTTYKLLYPAV